jgi:hypothetical protein
MLLYPILLGKVTANIKKQTLGFKKFQMQVKTLKASLIKLRWMKLQ